jgi:hypothetical protein
MRGWLQESALLARSNALALHRANDEAVRPVEAGGPAVSLKPGLLKFVRLA